MDRYEEALERAKQGLPIDEVFPELKESEDERIYNLICSSIKNEMPIGSPRNKELALAYLEKQKEQKPIIQDVELNDAVYDYVRDHFIAGADFTPEYIKKLMENAFFAGVDYYLLKQESESCELDTNIEKVIEDVIRVYGKTQGEWVGGYDVDTLIVNLRRAFNKKEQQPVAREKDFVSNPKTSAEILKHYLTWATSEEENCPYSWKELADAIRDGIKALEEKKPTAEEVLIKAGLKPFKDGNQWCVLAGDNIQEGVCGFGDKIEDALYDFLISVLDLQKEQKPTEWSEKDEKMRLACIDIIEHFPTPSGTVYGPWGDCINWLKALPERFNPQPHWKPSEEQMEALMLAIEGKCPPTSYMSRRLEELYEVLANTYKVECKLEN